MGYQGLRCKVVLILSIDPQLGTTPFYALRIICVLVLHLHVVSRECARRQVAYSERGSEMHP
jgi:hypothetical protein